MNTRKNKNKQSKIRNKQNNLFRKTNKHKKGGTDYLMNTSHMSDRHRTPKEEEAMLAEQEARRKENTRKTNCIAHKTKEDFDNDQENNCKKLMVRSRPNGVACTNYDSNCDNNEHEMEWKDTTVGNEEFKKKCHEGSNIFNEDEYLKMGCSPYDWHSSAVNKRLNDNKKKCIAHQTKEAFDNDQENNCKKLKVRSSPNGVACIDGVDLPQSCSANDHEMEWKDTTKGNEELREKCQGDESILNKDEYVKMGCPDIYRTWHKSKAYERLKKVEKENIKKEVKNNIIKTIQKKKEIYEEATDKTKKLGKIVHRLFYEKIRPFTSKAGLLDNDKVSKEVEDFVNGDERNKLYLYRLDGWDDVYLDHNAHIKKFIEDNIKKVNNILDKENSEGSDSMPLPPLYKNKILHYEFFYNSTSGLDLADFRQIATDSIREVIDELKKNEHKDIEVIDKLKPELKDKEVIEKNTGGKRKKTTKKSKKSKRKTRRRHK